MIVNAILDKVFRRATFRSSKVINKGINMTNKGINMYQITVKDKQGNSCIYHNFPEDSINKLNELLINDSKVLHIKDNFYFTDNLASITVLKEQHGNTDY
jgi:hypothetical protein